MKNSSSFASVVSTFFQRCWLIGTVVAIAALVWLADEPAWAGPVQQFTVPTATPQSFEPDDEELVPTATPEPLFELDDSSDESSNFEPIDEFDQPDEEPTPEPFIIEDEPEPDVVEIPEDNSLNDFNTDDSSNNFSDNIDTQVENDSGIADDNSFENTVPDITFNPIEEQTVSDDFGDFDSPDDSGLVGGGASSSEIGGSVDTQASDALSGSGSVSGIGANSGVVSISVLNIRRDPSPDSDIIDTLWRNDEVEISQTTSDGTWLLVCCGVELGSAGWVSSLYINYDSGSLNVSSLDSSSIAAPEVEEFIAEPATEFATEPATASTATSTTASATIANLELTMTVTDTTVQAGQILDIEYTVENIGNVDAQNVRLSNELPTDLYLNNFEMDATGQFTHTVNTRNNRRILSMIWPQVDAAQTVTATVKIQIAPGAPNGLVIDNLAGVNADNSNGDTAAISIGTPPLAPPSFRRR